MRHEDEGTRIAALCVGGVRQHRDADGAWSSAVLKTPVAGPVAVTPAGMAGDEVQDHQHHGGADKALLCYSAAHYPLWREETGLDVPPGALGENLLLEDLDECNVCLGDLWAAGEVRLEVSQPRVPCWKPARLWSRPSLTREMSHSGRVGWYMRVRQGGRLQAGMRLLLANRPHPEWSIARCWRTYQARSSQSREWGALQALPELAAAWRE